MSGIRQYIKKYPGLFAITLEGFLTRFGYGMVTLALPLYAYHLGLSLFEIGLLYSTRSITTMLFKPYMGKLADKIGRKPVLLASVFLRSVVIFLLIFASSAWHLFLIRMIHGVMTAARDPSAMALIGEYGDKSAMAMSFAWYLSARDLGRSLGFMAGGLLLTFMTYSELFFVAFLFTSMAIFTVVFFVKDSLEDGVSGAQTQGKAPLDIWVNWRQLLPYGLFGLSIATSAGMLRGLLPVIALEYANLSVAQIGVIVGFAGMVVIIAAPAFAWISDKVNRKLALLIRSIANIASSIIYMVFPNFLGFFSARMMEEAGNAAFRPTWGALLAELTEENPSSRAKTMAVVDTSTNIGDTLAPVLAGAVLSILGFYALFITRILISLLAEFQAYLLFRKKEQIIELRESRDA